MGKKADQILIKPIITEKSTLLEKEGKYVFEVSPKANKIEIKKAIQEVYKVKPVKVNLMRIKGKQIRSGRTVGRTKNWKKALVTLKKNEKLELTTK
ncbi:MAG: 50S ribosomal protein L23 [Patescibacteria group bacterium]|nr:50S ribosomal protein L23 [Patescibacteria group bacterium]